MTTNIKDLNIEAGYIEIIKKWKTRTKIRLSNGKTEVIWTPKDFDKIPEKEVLKVKISNYGNELQYFRLIVEEKIKFRVPEKLREGQYEAKIKKANAVLKIIELEQDNETFTIVMRVNKKETKEKRIKQIVSIYKKEENILIEGEYIKGLLD